MATAHSRLLIDHFQRRMAESVGPAADRYWIQENHDDTSALHHGKFIYDNFCALKNCR